MPKSTARSVRRNRDGDEEPSVDSGYGNDDMSVDMEGKPAKYSVWRPTYDCFMMTLFRFLGVTYIVMFFVYFGYRARYSLGNARLGYRIFVLVIEFFASINVVFVIFMRIRMPWTKYANQVDGATAAGLMVRPKKELFTPSSQKELSEVKVDDYLDGRPVRTDMLHEYEDDEDVDTQSEKLSPVTSSGPVKVYNVRVLVPCYKEDKEIVAGTCLAALKMDHPSENLFVYLLDDGADEDKIKWVQQMNAAGYPNLFYITRPKAFKGHGKAGNLNYTLKHIIYGEDANRISKSELVVIFDADMVGAENFIARLLPYFYKDRKCVMVQTPQTFHNVPMSADFFDAHNLNFFQYMLPAMSEWNTTTCCGTNFIVSARALGQVGWFPTISVTEDMYLAMKLLAAGGVVKYHAENLSVGEAPQDLRQVFQQRSRWAKGTIQIAIKDSPLKNKGLNLIQKLSFFNAIWSYFTSAFMNPLFVIINSLGILVGLYPVTQVTFQSAMLFISYYILFYGILHFTPNPRKHYTGLWIVGKMGHFFSFMALKAIFNVIKKEIASATISFKVTEKKAGVGGPKPDEENKEEDDDDYGEDDEEYFADDRGNRDSTRKDIRFHIVMVTFIVFVIAYGIYILLGYTAFLPDVKDERSTLEKKGIRLFGVCWMAQFFIAYSLPIWYAFLPDNFGTQSSALSTLCKIDTILSLGLLMLTVVLFKVPFFEYIPKIPSIYTYDPVTYPLWVTSASTSDLTDIFNYIQDTAIGEHIPTIVINNRPSGDMGALSDGGATDYVQYSKQMDSIAAKITSIDFPINVVLEPSWMVESMNIYPVVGTTTSYQIAVNDSDTNDIAQRTVYWNAEKWYNLIDVFISFANKMNSMTNVYVDAGNVYYHQLMNSEALKELYDNIANTRINGVALNVASFYPTNATISLGKQLYKKYNWHFVVDTSRNGGKWTNQTYKQINTCKYDPPFVASGLSPGWAEQKQRWIGYDGNLWVKIPGESDGRLYPAGEYHECLMHHNINCSSTCPEVPVERPLACQCD
eukprot:TRINITY_DN15938_c0_g1_i1.p1 TRINITY_DN15938_c0_g1~~TRINITY_DN15938_c0_g1_i1.p1  ORF type:complete len:1027 (-),score=263.03 TRINITY_DN15938_c0_g1_i1:61-3141(-)